MDSLITALSLTVALFGAAGGVLAWIAKLRWSTEYRAAVDARIASQDEVIKSKDAQLGQAQESLRTKDATIESLKVFTYADADRHITALKNLYEGRVSDLSKQLKEAATQLASASADLAQGNYPNVRRVLELSANVTLRAAGTLSEIDETYKRGVEALNARDDDLAAIQRGSLQAMAEANRIRH